MTDFAWPQDAGIGTHPSGSGDKNDAANYAAAYDAIGRTDFVKQGMGFTVDYTSPAADIASGKAVLTDGSATATQEGEDRDEGVAFVVETDARTGVSLTDGAVNHVFLDLSLGSDDATSFHIDTDNTPPSQPYLKVGEIDTSADSKQEMNRAPSEEFESIRIGELNNTFHVRTVAQSEVQDLLDQQNADGGGDVFIPARTAITVSETPLTIPSNVSLEGPGPFSGAKIRRADGDDDNADDLIRIEAGTENITIDGIEVDGNWSNQTLSQDYPNNPHAQNIQVEQESGDPNPENVTVKNIYSHDAIRSCLAIGSNNGTYENLWLEDSHTDHLLYLAMGENNSIRNVWGRGRSRSSMIPVGVTADDPAVRNTIENVWLWDPIKPDNHPRPNHSILLRGINDGTTSNGHDNTLRNINVRTPDASDGMQLKVYQPGTVVDGYRYRGGSSVPAFRAEGSLDGEIRAENIDVEITQTNAGSPVGALEVRRPGVTVENYRVEETDASQYYGVFVNGTDRAVDNVRVEDYQPVSVGGYPVRVDGGTNPVDVDITDSPELTVASGGGSSDDVYATGDARWTLNGLGYNSGDPSTGGVWNGNGYEGVPVLDVDNSNLYRFANDAWRGPL